MPLREMVQNMQGLAALAEQRRQVKIQEEQMAKQKAGMEALNQYIETEKNGMPDMSLFYKAVTAVPDAAGNVLKGIGIDEKRKAQDASRFIMEAAPLVENRDAFLQKLNSRIDFLRQNGRNPSESEMLREQYLAGDVAGVKNNLKGVAGALVGTGNLDPKAYEYAFGKPDEMNEYQKANIEIDKQRLALQQNQMASQRERDNSYYTFSDTASGIVKKNARTGQVELATDPTGNPIIGAAADPTLQGRITESEKTGALNAERVSETKKALKMNDQILQYTKKASELLPKATGSGVGSAVDAAGRLVGVSSKSSEAAAKLKTLSGWLVSNVPRMEGPQSNIDVQNYQKMAGDIGNDRLTIEERIASLEALNQLIATQKQINNQVLTGKMQSIYDPNYVPQSQPQGGDVEAKRRRLEELRAKQGG